MPVAKVRQACESVVTINVTPQAPKKFTLALRRPFWAGSGFSVKINGCLTRP